MNMDKIVDKLVDSYDVALIICSDYNEDTETVKGFIRANGRKDVLAHILLDFIEDNRDLQTLMHNEIEERINKNKEERDDLFDKLQSAIDLLEEIKKSKK